MNRAQRTTIPLNSLIFGYGPMIPFILAATGFWTLPVPWPALAVWLVVVWGALILCFVGGVRRGFGFGSDRASTLVEIATMLVYFTIAGVALILPWPRASLFLLAIGFATAAICDTRAAQSGNAPAHFAALRIPQFATATLCLLAIALGL